VPKATGVHRTGRPGPSALPDRPGPDPAWTCRCVSRC